MLFKSLGSKELVRIESEVHECWREAHLSINTASVSFGVVELSLKMSAFVLPASWDLTIMALSVLRRGRDESVLSMTS